MNDEKRKEIKNKLIGAKYQILACDIIFNHLELQSTISFRAWVNYYGLYCSGKDVNADTVEFGNALLEANVETITDLEEGIVRGNKKTISADLNLDSANLKLNK